MIDWIHKDRKSPLYNKHILCLINGEFPTVGIFDKKTKSIKCEMNNNEYRLKDNFIIRVGHFKPIEITHWAYINQPKQSKE